MPKNIDYSKIKALAASILQAIGDDEEGANPKLGKQKTDFNDGGQESLDDLSPVDEGDTGGAPRSLKQNPDAVQHEESESEEYEASEPQDDEEDGSAKKRKKDASLAMMASVLGSKFNK